MRSIIPIPRRQRLLARSGRTEVDYGLAAPAALAGRNSLLRFCSMLLSAAASWQGPATQSGDLDSFGVAYCQAGVQFDGKTERGMAEVFDAESLLSMFECARNHAAAGRQEKIGAPDGEMTARAPPRLVSSGASRP